MNVLIGLYNAGVVYGLIFTGIVIGTILTVGLVRLAYRYAMAQDINVDDDVMMSTWFSRWAFYCAVVLESKWEKTELKESEVEEFFGPYGADFRGTLIDMLVAGILIMLLVVSWPLILTIAIVMIPLYKLHEKNKVKREFFEKLKGEKAQVEE